MRLSRPAARTFSRPRSSIGSLMSTPMTWASVALASAIATGGARRDVQDAARLVVREVPDQLPAPLLVLAEGQHAGQAVVAGRHVLEEPDRERVLRARSAHFENERTFSRR